MTIPSRPPLRLPALAAALGAAALLSACVIEAPPGYVRSDPSPAYPRPAPVYPRPAPVYPSPASAYDQSAPPDARDDAFGPEDDQAADDDPVVSVYVEPPIDQPEPIAVEWAPPPMLVEVPPPQPFEDAVWTGGYWAWEGRWVWAAGRWAPPPRPRYVWVQPYYEHRADVVVFVPGFWCAPERRFVPPAPSLRIALAVARPGVHRGHRPLGPQGVFVPPPPGSRRGLVVPAPVGTPPAVVVSAPPVVNVGMRVHGAVDRDGRNGANPRNVTIEAPAGATATGRAFRHDVPGRAPLAAELAPAGRPAAPHPVSTQAIPAYQPGRPPAALPADRAGIDERAGRHEPGARDDRNGRPDWPGGRRPAPPAAALPPPAAPPQGMGAPQWRHGDARAQRPDGQEGAQDGVRAGGQRPGPSPMTPQAPPSPVVPPQGPHPAARPGAQPPAPAAQPPQVRGRDGQPGADVPGRVERRQPPNERPDDRQKKAGERDR